MSTFINERPVSAPTGENFARPRGRRKFCQVQFEQAWGLSLIHAAQPADTSWHETCDIGGD